MPLTPFHLGPGIFGGVIFFRYLNFFAFLLGSIVLDIDPFFQIFIKKCYYCPHHGILHSFLGGIVGALILAIFLKIFSGKINNWLSKFHLSQSSSFLNIFFSGLLGWWFHIIFDSFMHDDVFPFWPSAFNPLLNLISISQIYLLTLILGIIGGVLLFRKIKKDYDPPTTL